MNMMNSEKKYNEDNQLRLFPLKLYSTYDNNE